MSPGEEEKEGRKTNYARIRFFKKKKRENGQSGICEIIPSISFGERESLFNVYTQQFLDYIIQLIIGLFVGT